jgi:hypothetical protein
MAACRSSLENTGKMNLKLVLNKTSPWAHTELELDVLGVPKKLVKYVCNSLVLKKKVEFLFLFLFFSAQAVQTAID